tara:strand:- start:465 stop:1307 length:843 start_codon:yes stop_codon:yes gene_type:complete
MLSHFKTLISILFLSQGMSSGLQFLSIPSSANDLIIFRSAWRNPSFLNISEKSPELSFAYGKWFGETENLSFEWQGKIRSHSTGIAMRYVGINDIELRDNRPSSDPLGYYGAYGVSSKLATSFSRGNINYGFAFQMISMQIYQDESSGFATDLGISWQVSEKINIASSIVNFGKMNSFRNERPVLPTRFNNILTYKLNRADIFVSYESNELIEKPIYSIGSAFKIDNIFFGATAIMNDDSRMISSGIGINLGSYSFSYGFQYGNQDIGFPQIIDISFRLP